MEISIVYIVVKSDYDGGGCGGSEIIGVYNSKELAEFKKPNDSSQGDYGGTTYKVESHAILDSKQVLQLYTNRLNKATEKIDRLTGANKK